MTNGATTCGPAPAHVGLGLSLATLGPVTDFDAIQELARSLEAAGLEYLVLPDRPAGPLQAHDPIVVSALMLAATTTVRVVATIVLPLRQPLILAKQLASLAQLSAGRLILCSALGGDYPAEFGVANQRVEDRVKTFEDNLATLRRLLTNGDPSVCLTQDPDRAKFDASIPIWIAHRARSTRSVERSARLGDGWYASWVSAKRFGETLDGIRKLLVPGRSFDAAVVVRVNVAKSVAEAAQEAANVRAGMYGLYGYEEGPGRYYHALGPPEACVEKLSSYLEHAPDVLVLQPECASDHVATQISRIVEEVVPAVRWNNGVR